MISTMVKGLKHTYESFIAVKQTDPLYSIFQTFDFALGLIAVRNLVETIYYADPKYVELYEHLPLWQQEAFKVIDIMGRISLILGGLKSKPNVIVWKWVAKNVLTVEYFERFFGNSGLYPPDKIYQMIAVCAFILGIPSTLKTIFAICTKTAKPKLPDSKPLNEGLRNSDVFLTIKEISETAQRIIMATPHK